MNVKPLNRRTSESHEQGVVSGSPLTDVNDRYWQEYWNLRSKYFADARNCQQLYEEFIESYLERETEISWLDVGCGHTLLHHGGEEKSLKFVQRTKFAVGLDCDVVALSRNRIFSHRLAGDVESLPFGNDSFDLITANMVVEHLRNPIGFVREIVRVLKPGGAFVVHTPNLFHWEALLAYLTPHKFHELCCWLIEKRDSSDVYPVFYRANTLSVLKKLFNAVGMRLEQGGTIADVPRRFPVPLLSRVLLLLSIVEVRLLSSGFFMSFRHNLLLAFRK